MSREVAGLPGDAVVVEELMAQDWYVGRNSVQEMRTAQGMRATEP